MKAQGEGWLLTVTLVSGENLSPLDETGTRDPFVVFTCNGKTRTSLVKLKTLNPEWHGIKSLFCFMIISTGKSWALNACVQP